MKRDAHRGLQLLQDSVLHFSLLLCSVLSSFVKEAGRRHRWRQQIVARVAETDTAPHRAALCHCAATASRPDSLYLSRACYPHQSSHSANMRAALTTCAIRAKRAALWTRASHLQALRSGWFVCVRNSRHMLCTPRKRANATDICTDFPSTRSTRAHFFLTMQQSRPRTHAIRAPVPALSACHCSAKAGLWTTGR